MKKHFDPIKLIGEEILFQCATCKGPKTLKIISIKKHMKGIIMNGGLDIVIYETNKGEFILEQTTITSLHEDGFYESKSGAKYKMRRNKNSKN